MRHHPLRRPRAVQRRTRVCANCGARLAGAYCSQCGQKRFEDADRRFGNVAQQLVESLTDLDGRFLGSLRALLFQPGTLSRDYIEGRRARRMSPIALFLFVNLVYFVFAQQSDFATPFTWEVPGRIAIAAQAPEDVTAEERMRLENDPGPLHSRFTASLVEKRVAERNARALEASGGASGYDYRDYARAYDARVPEISKALAILHVPLLALALMLMFARRGCYYAEHFVVALHLVAFYMATILVFGHASSLVHAFVPFADWHTALLNWSIRILLAVYITLALRKAYAVGWPWALAGMAGLLAAYALVNFHVYRPILFLAVFAAS